VVPRTTHVRNPASKTHADRRTALTHAPVAALPIPPESGLNP
jgi:hypothetical protein